MIGSLTILDVAALVTLTGIIIIPACYRVIKDIRDEE